MRKITYSCPMHSEIISEKPGRCPKCGMDLEVIKNNESGIKSEALKSALNNKNSYNPLIIVVGLIFISSFAISYPQFNLRDIIVAFMSGFFIVFAGFKLVDLKGFAQGYSTYDLLARRWFVYGYIYPFLELAFGLLMILRLFEMEVLVGEIVIMTFSGIGVLIKVLKKERFQCVCLGTFLKVPLTYVTLIEDFGMAALGIVLLITS